MNRKYNINIGNSNITIGADVQPSTGTLEYVTPNKVMLSISRSRYRAAVKDYVKGLLKDNGINIKNDQIIEEIANSTYDHFTTLLQRENNIEFKEVEFKEIESYK